MPPEANEVWAETTKMPPGAANISMKRRKIGSQGTAMKTRR